MNLFGGICKITQQQLKADAPKEMNAQLKQLNSGHIVI